LYKLKDVFLCVISQYFGIELLPEYRQKRSVCTELKIQVPNKRIKHYCKRQICSCYRLGMALMSRSTWILYRLSENLRFFCRKYLHDTLISWGYRAPWITLNWN